MTHLRTQRSDKELIEDMSRIIWQQNGQLAHMAMRERRARRFANGSLWIAAAAVFAAIFLVVERILNGGF